MFWCRKAETGATGTGTRSNLLEPLERVESAECLDHYADRTSQFGTSQRGDRASAGSDAIWPSRWWHQRCAAVGSCPGDLLTVLADANILGKVVNPDSLGALHLLDKLS